MEMIKKEEKKSEGILNPYNDKLKKAHLHGGGYIEIDGVEYSPDEYITMLEEANENLVRADKKKSDHIDELEEENKKLKEEKEIRALNDRDNLIQIEKLEEENRKLKEKIEQIKEAYIRFENSEKEYNKGLGELDQLIMNR